MATDGPDRADRADAVLRRHGMRAWMLVGIVLLTSIVYMGLAAISGLVVPLVVASVVGILFVPIVDRLATRMPRPVASLIVLVVLVVAGVGVAVVTVKGIVDQAPQIGRELSAGLQSMGDWLEELGVGVGATSVDRFGDLLSGALGGLGSTVSTVFSSATAFVSGGLIGIFLLYFVLADWRRLAVWVGGHLGPGHEVGAGIVDDATFLTRQYFVALTVSSVVTAVVIGAAATLLGVPLAFTIAVVTFVTAYVPYLGAIFSGAFAALLALGSGGLSEALILLGVILVAQNVIQTLVQTKMTEDRLDLHPIVIFGSTIVGAAVAGILGAALSAPAVALGIRVTERISQVEQAEQLGTDVR